MTLSLWGGGGLYDLNDLQYLYEFWTNKRNYVLKNIKKNNSEYVSPDILIIMIDSVINDLQCLSLYTYGYDLERRIFL